MERRCSQNNDFLTKTETHMKKFLTSATLVLALCLTGCIDNDPYGAAESEATITARVQQELADEGVPGNIQVTSRANLVTLTGTVPDQDAKEKAEDVAHDVDGVDRVMNNLRTTMAGDAPAASGPR
jgi:osmotically-inducible protein OsmY